jgi:hypothetical protein
VGSVGQGFAFPGANVTGYTYVYSRSSLPCSIFAHLRVLLAYLRKRITVGGMVFVAYAVGNLIGRILKVLGYLSMTAH